MKTPVGIGIAATCLAFVLGTYIGEFLKSVNNTPLEALVQHSTTIAVTVNETKCYGIVAHSTPDEFVGAPPRLWLCEGLPPYYDESGVRLPNTPPTTAASEASPP